MTVFGLIYGDFLKSIGNETAGTTLSNGIFNTVSSLAGKIIIILKKDILLIDNNLFRSYYQRVIKQIL